MQQTESKCENIFEQEYTEQELSLIFTQKWVEFINKKEQQQTN